jgi:SAM-dependent methyltransferase
MTSTESVLLPAGEAASEPALRKLNLGCGRDIYQGWINLDRANLPGVDVVHDLEQLPLPFKDKHFDHIQAKDVLEHVDCIRVLRELHRILKDGGTLSIRVPHFTSADNYIDPTHKHRFSIRTFEFFVTDSSFARDYYFDFAFRSIAQRKVTFSLGLYFYNYLVQPFVNSHRTVQKLYELTFLSRLFPAQGILVTLVK